MVAHQGFILGVRTTVYDMVSSTTWKYCSVSFSWMVTLYGFFHKVRTIMCDTVSSTTWKCSSLCFIPMVHLVTITLESSYTAQKTVHFCVQTQGFHWCTDVDFLVLFCFRIIGLYVGFVWLIGKFVRLFFTSISYRIMFDEMPNVDKVLKLCLDIFMVRESKELELEEDLFAKLMFLYRSPQTLIKWTKYKRN